MTGTCFASTIFNYGAGTFSASASSGAHIGVSGNSLTGWMPSFSVGETQTEATFTDSVTVSGGTASGFTYDFSSFTGPSTGTVTLTAATSQITFDLGSPTGFFSISNAPSNFTLGVDITVSGSDSGTTTLPQFTVTGEATPEPVSAGLAMLGLLATGLLVRWKVRRH